MTVFMDVRGDATRPIGTGPKIIAHVVNDRAVWGAGFTQALSNRWDNVEGDYKLWRINSSRMRGADRFMLGHVRGTWINLNAGADVDDLIVIHMLAQQGLRSPDNPRPLRYDALGACLLQVGRFAVDLGASVHMPRIGCGLAGGRWELVEPLVHDALFRQGVNTYVYDLEQ